MQSNKNHLFIFGFGYTCRYLSQQLNKIYWKISGSTRSIDNFAMIKQCGANPYLFNDKTKVDFSKLTDVTHILMSIPPAETGDIVYKLHLDDIKALPKLRWVGYLSTTGVYGDYKGKWIDETAQLKANNQRLKLRIAAEKDWLNSGLPAHIFRLAGIYGPDRNVFVQLNKGTAKRIEKKNLFFSRIHVADIANVLQASIQKPNPGSIYNICDDLPCSQEQVVSYAANLLGVKPPPLIPFSQANLSDMAKSFYKASRKVSNQKIKSELGVKLLYPTYKEGLTSLLS